MQKYDFVEVVELIDTNSSYEEIGQVFIGKKAMIIDINTSIADGYCIELCFFNQELQELAMEEGFDYWKEEELELI